MLIIISLLIGFFISFILLTSVTNLTINMEENSMIVYSIYIIIALIISSSILIIETIKKHCSNKQD